MVASNLTAEARAKSKSVVVVSTAMEAWLKERGQHELLATLELAQSDYRAQRNGNGLRYSAYTTEKLVSVKAKHQKALDKINAELARRS